MNDLANNAIKVAEYLFGSYERILPSLQTFSLVITGVLLFFVVYMMTKANVVGGKTDKFVDKWNLADMSKVKVNRAWKEIMQEIKSGNSAKMKKAINDADKILDEALKAKGYIGKHMDERLDRIDDSQLETVREVRQAHALSERIKKDPSLALTQNEAINIIHIYGKAFKEFELIK